MLVTHIVQTLFIAGIFWLACLTVLVVVRDMRQHREDVRLSYLPIDYDGKIRRRG